MYNMKMNVSIKKCKEIIVLVIITLFTSCTSSIDIVYFQDEPIKNNENVSFNTDIEYKSNDMLIINVAGDPDAVKPFNLPSVSYNISEVNVQGNIKMQSYLVDIEGNIEFPVLGTIKIGGLTRTQATALLKERLVVYIKDPIINIRLINFTITVLGEVNNPGTFTIEDEKISLPEALGMAGDLTIQGRRDNVFLIREENGVKQFTKFDLTSINVVNSPNYYLRQDDVIYVEPNKSRIRSASYNQNNAIIISGVATLAAIIAILVN